MSDFDYVIDGDHQTDLSMRLLFPPQTTESIILSATGGIEIRKQLCINRIS